MRRAFFVLTCGCFVATTALSFPEGTFFLSDIDNLVKQKIELWNQVTRDFDVYPVGNARMISRVENVKLNGIRIGPYYLFAKPKGKKGSYTYEITIETKVVFYDENRNEVSLDKASDEHQQLSKVCIRPLSAEGYFSP